MTNFTLCDDPTKTRYTTCPYCGLEGEFYWHHVFGGSNKKKSEKYGAIIYPCPICHIWGTDSIHKQQSQQKNKDLKSIYQQRIMNERNMSIEEWIAVFNKSYL